MRQNSVYLSLINKECQVGKNRNPKDLSIISFRWLDFEPILSITYYHCFPLA